MGEISRIFIAESQNFGQRIVLCQIRLFAVEPVQRYAFERYRRKCGKAKIQFKGYHIGGAAQP